LTNKATEEGQTLILHWSFWNIHRGYDVRAHCR